MNIAVETELKADIAVAAGESDEGVVRFILLRTLFASRRSKVFGVAFLVLVLIALVGPFFAPYGKNEQDVYAALQGPTAHNWLGTDRFGRDILSLLLHGLRISLMAGAVAVGVGIVLGVPAGLLAGYSTRIFKQLSNIVSDVLLSIPQIIFALAVISTLGRGLVNSMIAIGILLAPRFYRLARSMTESVSERTYMEASRAIGCPPSRLLGRHVLPNISAPLVVQITFGCAFAIVAEASISFLGFGTQPPDTSLGSMVAQAFENVNRTLWPLFPPAVVVALVVYIVSALGDAMQDSLQTGGVE